MFCSKLVRCSLALPLAVSLAVCPWNPSVAAAPASTDSAKAPHLVLGLDGEDESAAAALTQALSEQLAGDGTAKDTAMTAAELRLASGCSIDDMECLARSGRATGAATIYIGALSQNDSGFLATIHVLDTKSASELNRRTFRFAFSALSKSNIAATAKLMLEFLGERPAAADIDEPVELVIENTTESTTPPEPVEQTPAPHANKPETSHATESPAVETAASSAEANVELKPFRRGPYVAGVAVGAGITLAAIGVSVVTKYRLRSDGPIRTELLDLADQSVEDDDSDNDVSKFSSQNLCTLASETTGGGVRNPDMVDVCDRAARLKTFNHIAIGTAIGAGAITAVIAGIWIKKHRAYYNNPPRHQVRLDFNFTREHFGLDLRGRF